MNRHSRPTRRSPSLAAFLSFLWPGLGQLYLRRREVAAFFAVPALVALAIAGYESLQGPVGLALSMLNQTFALTVLLVIVLVAVWRLWSILHAYYAAAHRLRPASRTDGFVLTVLVVAVLVMHTVPAYLTFAAYDLSGAIAKPFDSGWTSPGATPDPSERPSMSADPGFTAPPVKTVSDRVTVLLVGVDSGMGRDHALTDTMLLVSLDKTTNKVTMLSVPRDTTMFKLYWNGATLGPTFKLNALTTGVANKWFASPDAPMVTLQKEIGYLVGIPVDYYAAVDLSGFQQLIDLAGGVDINIPAAFYDPLQQHQWKAGLQHMNGATALMYVRSRYADNDYMRAGRQQAVLVALKKKLVGPQMITRLPSLISITSKFVRTNYPLDHAAELTPLAENAATDSIINCVLGAGYSYHPDSATTNGVWTSRLHMDKVADLSVALFGQDSSYYGQAGVTPQGCSD